MKSAQPNPIRARLRTAAGAMAIALAAFVALPSSAGAASATHWLVPSHEADAVVRSGAVLYGVHCSNCHGADLGGLPGAPSLLASGGAAVDFYLSTGRMPLALRAVADGGVQVEHGPPYFDAQQTVALDAYVDARARARTPIPRVVLDVTKLQAGRRLFEENCQACHGAAAQGATAGERWVALPLNRASPTQIGEAIRIGPGVMPRFTARQLTDEQIDAVATYVRYLVNDPQSYGGATMQYLGPISEGAVSAIVGVGFLFWVIYYTGTKADGRRFNELD